jgi:hypothetical protein
MVKIFVKKRRVEDDKNLVRLHYRLEMTAISYFRGLVGQLLGYGRIYRYMGGKS